VFLAPSRSDLDESILITTLLGVPPENPTVKHRQLAPTVGPLANDRQKNSMASLDDNHVLEEGTSLCIGSWIFIADGSGGFKSCSIDQDPPEVSEAAKQCEFDEFIDQLEKVGVSDLINEARIRRNQSQNTYRIRRGFEGTVGRFQVVNFHELKDHTFQLHLRL